MFSEEIYRHLREFGLSKYESKVYLTLLNYGDLTAKEISKLSTVPYSRVHEVLTNLSSRGLVKVDREKRPAKYAPSPPMDALETLRLRIDAKLRESEKFLLDSLQPIYERLRLREKPEIWVIYGEENVTSKLIEVVGEVKEELLIALPFTLRKVEVVDKLLESLKLKGISVKVLVTREVNEMYGKSIRKFDFRVREEMFGGGIIADGREALIFLGESKTKLNLAIWSRHTGLTLLARQYFYHLWETSGRSLSA